MGIAAMSVHSLPLPHSKTTLLHASAAPKRHPWRSLKPLSSRSLSSCALEQGSSPPSTSSDDSPSLPLRGCKACGREEVEKGCNGEGRMQGGIATVPGFGWWPIKAYRPCPEFLAAGGRYRRSGQSLDEVAFGRGRRETSDIEQE